MLSCGIGPVAGADPWAASGPALSEQGPARMPSGMANLCARLPAICASAGATQVPPVALSGSEAVLSRVNSGINHRIASTTDRDLYGREEYWTLPSTAGDCEDYVLLKRQELLQLGFAPGSLLITVVHDENGEAHAVLTVPTTQGDVVLDNRRDEILPWWQTGYSFIKRQSAADPVRWVSLGSEKLQATDVASGPGLP